MDIAETISHHILDHDWGVVLDGFRIPITTHSVTIFCVSVFLFLTLVWAARKHTSHGGKLVTVLMEEYLYQSEHNNARRQRFIKAGLCSKCGGTLTDTNYKMCERCRTYMYSHTLKYREGHANG